jgi:hypothetical protein
LPPPPVFPYAAVLLGFPGFGHFVVQSGGLYRTDSLAFPAFRYGQGWPFHNRDPRRRPDARTDANWGAARRAVPAGGGMPAPGAPRSPQPQLCPITVHKSSNCPKSALPHPNPSKTRAFQHSKDTAHGLTGRGAGRSLLPSQVALPTSAVVEDDIHRVGRRAIAPATMTNGVSFGCMVCLQHIMGR